MKENNIKAKMRSLKEKMMLAMDDVVKLSLSQTNGGKLITDIVVLIIEKHPEWVHKIIIDRNKETHKRIYITSLDVEIPRDIYIGESMTLPEVGLWINRDLVWDKSYWGLWYVGQTHWSSTNEGALETSALWNEEALMKVIDTFNNSIKTWKIK